MRTAEGLRNEAMAAALREAVSGKRDRLYGMLAVASGLPGARANMALAQGFAQECVTIGPPADRLAFAMAGLSADEAPGASPYEFLPMCGVLALGARAAADASLRPKVLAHLHDAAEDLRFRVREIVPLALARIGEKEGDALVAEVSTWTDGFFQAAAVLLALSEPLWLSSLRDPTGPLARLEEAFALARDAPRSAVRWPGWKALAEALSSAPAALATRFGVPVFEQLAIWAGSDMPELRQAVEANLRSKKLAGRHAPEIARVRQALETSAPPPRDPTLIVQGTRGRGKKRRR